LDGEDSVKSNNNDMNGRVHKEDAPIESRKSSPGLNYRKAPVEDDVLSTRYSKQRDSVSHQSNTVSPEEVAKKADVKSGANTGKVMADDEYERIKKLKIEYAKKWKESQKQKEEVIPKVTVDESIPSNIQVSETDASEEDEPEYGSDAYYFQRFKISRQYSRPVEATLKRAKSNFRSISSYYEVLGVSPKASLNDIKKSFRAKSLKIHPGNDMNISIFIGYHNWLYQIKIRIQMLTKLSTYYPKHTTYLVMLLNGKRTILN
jgi:curved DNA-binding protein CbpA